MKKLLLLFVTILSILLIDTKDSYAQVDSLHYIPPMCSFTNSKANVQDHRMVLTTSESTAFTVTITNKDGSFVKTVSLSSSSPRQVNLNSPGTVLNSQGIIGTSDLNKVLDTEGLIVSGAKKFFVSIQNKSTAQGDLLTSKGTTGLGTDFYSGHMYSEKSGYDSHNGHFISAIATENNTNITFSNPRIKFAGKSSKTFTVSLNKGQSTVIGISYDQMQVQLGQNGDLNVINGTHITSNKPIAVSSGSMCASGYSGANGRDVGFDQLVPTDVVGEEYILIKGEGTGNGPAHNERALIVATEANTSISYYYYNSSNNLITKTTTLNNPGDYYFTNWNEFIKSRDKNMYIKSDKKIFVYQTLSGANKQQTAGLCFIPPLKCTADKEVTIAFTNKLSSLDVNPILKLVTQKGSQIKLNGVNLKNASSYKRSVASNTYWETYNIPKSELQNSAYNAGTNWVYKISSDNALNAMLAVESNNVGGGGYFSGFGDVPQIEQNPEIESQGLCGDNVRLTATGFNSYNWYKDGVLVATNDDEFYEPSNPGRYKVTGLSPCGDSNTESFPSNEIRILPCLSVNPDKIEVTEGTDLHAMVRVQLSHTWLASDKIDVTFDYETIAGSATSGKDYTPETGSATIFSGQAYIDIPVEIAQDNLNEYDEEFTFIISNVKEAVESITTGTITIKDDNDPMPTISVSNQTVNEDAGTVNIPINLNTESGKEISVTYTLVSNTAVHPDDYTSTNYTETITFNPGEKNKSISISIIDDNLYEPGTNEFFTVQLSSLVNTTAGNTSANISIVDNETPPEINVADVSETEGTNIVFQANLSHPADEIISFNYAIALSNGPTNAKQQDFINYSSFATGTITIPAGQTTFDFPAFTTKDDNANEQAENFIVNFTGVINANLGNTATTGTILDNEGDPTLSIANASATEGDALSFTISVSPIKSSDIVFQYRTINGSASSLTDFNGTSWTSITLPANSSSITLSIATIQDTEEEGTETFTVEIGNQPSGIDLAANPETATGTILDDDDTPDARNDNYSVDEDAVLTGNVMTNDLGLSDAPVTVISNTNPANGTLTINNDGSFTYTPTSNYNGTDSFEYTIQDIDGDQSTATVSITVNPTNDLPIANNDSYTINEDTQLNNDVTSNDQNLFDLPITITLINNASNGTLTLNADGTFTYMPNSEYFGTDNFTYKLTDGNGDAVTANADITITFINDAAPVAVNDNVSTNEDTAVTIDVLSNDSDVDGNQTIDKASVLIKTAPSHGSLSQDYTTGKVTYTPNNNYTGADFFTYTIKDNSGSESNIATVSINVTVDNDPPVAICKSGVTVYLDATGNYILTPAEIDNGSNDDNDGGTVTLSVFPNTFDCSDKGTVSVTLKATDEDNSSTTCTTDITIADNSNPTVKTTQTNITISAESGICGALVNYAGPVFTDNCDGDQSGTLKNGLSSGSTFPVGTTTVTYEYIDASGNTPIQSSFTVTIIDDVLPVINNISNQNLSPNNSGCTYIVSGTAFDAGATDNCGIANISHNYDGGGSSLNGKLFPIGTTDVTWTATDINGNPKSQVVQITVSTNLGVTINGPAGNSNCEAEDAVFTGSVSGGNPAYTYQFFVNNTEETIGVSGNKFTTSTLMGGDQVKTRVTDSYGCSIESNEITMTIYPKPNPKLYHE